MSTSQSWVLKPWLAKICRWWRRHAYENADKQSTFGEQNMWTNDGVT